MEKIKIAQELIRIAKMITTSNPNEEQLIQQLGQLSRQFSTTDISQIIPINFEQSSLSGISNMLDAYRSFLAKKQTKLKQMQYYIEQLSQTLDKAQQYFNSNKQRAKQIIDQCPRFQKVLSDDPKIRTKSNPKSQAFFRLNKIMKPSA